MVDRNPRPARMALSADSRSPILLRPAEFYLADVEILSNTSPVRLFERDHVSWVDAQ